MSFMSIRMLAEPLRKLTAAQVTASGTTFISIKPYNTPSGSIPLINPCRILLTQNTTDNELWFSFDGTTPHYVVPAGSFVLLDVTTNKSIVDAMYFAVGTIIYVAVPTGGVNPTTGNVYLSAFYGSHT